MNEFATGATVGNHSRFGVRVRQGVRHRRVVLAIGLDCYGSGRGYD